MRSEIGAAEDGASVLQHGGSHRTCRSVRQGRCAGGGVGQWSQGGSVVTEQGFGGRGAPIEWLNQW